MGASPPNPSSSCSVCALTVVLASVGAAWYRRGTAPLFPGWSGCMVRESECYVLDLVQLDRATRAFAARQGEFQALGWANHTSRSGRKN